MGKEDDKQKKGKIGLSVSWCIKDIIEGKVAEEDVEMIIGRTAASNREEWLSVIEHCKKTFWTKNPEEAEAICHRFIEAGKITQPRLKGERCPNRKEGTWTDTIPQYIPK